MTAPPPSPRNGPHFRQLDGLRALAVTLVLWQHTGTGRLLTIGRQGVGVYGVWLFFVLSGFLITGILLRSRDRIHGYGMASALRTFYVRRSLRIFPAFYVALAIAFACSFGRIHELYGWFATYSLNWYIFLNGWVGSGSHIWSLCIEEQFYLCWPFLILATPRRWLPFIFSSLLIIAPLARYAILVHTGSSDSVLTATPSALDSLGIGALLAWMKHARPISAATLDRLCQLAGTIGASMLLLMFIQQGLHLSVPGLPGPQVVENTLEAAAASLVSVYAVNGAVNGFAGWRARLLDSGPAQYVGRISYGVYLYHGIVIAALSRYVGERSGFAWFALVYSATLAVASTSWVLLERPFNSLKDRLSTPSARTTLSVAQPIAEVANSQPTEA